MKTAFITRKNNGGYDINIVFNQTTNVESPNDDEKTGKTGDTAGIATVATVISKRDLVDAMKDKTAEKAFKAVGVSASDINFDNYNLITNGSIKAKIDKTGNLTYSLIHVDITTSGYVLVKGEKQNASSDTKITKEEAYTITWG